MFQPYVLLSPLCVYLTLCASSNTFMTKRIRPLTSLPPLSLIAKVCRRDDGRRDDSENGNQSINQSVEGAGEKRKCLRFHISPTIGKVLSSFLQQSSLISSGNLFLLSMLVSYFSPSFFSQLTSLFFAFFLFSIFLSLDLLYSLDMRKYVHRNLEKERNYKQFSKLLNRFSHNNRLISAEERILLLVRGGEG